MTERTEFNEYGMSPKIYDTTIIEKAEELIRHGEDPRKAYELIIRKEEKHRYDI